MGNKKNEHKNASNKEALTSALQDECKKKKAS
jgi:hypothetical protein